ncbi:MAG: transglutaminase family protein [Pseudomonadota bacterium]
MLLSVRHVTKYAYEPAAVRAALRLKLFPGQTRSQAPIGWSVTINGQPPSTPIINSYGDREAIWLTQGETSEIEIIAEGKVETSDSNGVLGDLPMAARAPMFMRKTDLTASDEAIVRLADETSGEAGLARAHALSALVRERVDYSPGETEAATTAAEALAKGVGVCQDHAHILIAAARAASLPARYVAGYLLTDEGEAAETETHAWAELWLDGLGWVGFDPANEVCPTDRYVRLASGLDAADAAPIKGAVVGEAEETLTAEVQVAEAAQ